MYKIRTTVIYASMLFSDSTCYLTKTPIPKTNHVSPTDFDSNFKPASFFSFITNKLNFRNHIKAIFQGIYISITVCQVPILLYYSAALPATQPTPPYLKKDREAPADSAPAPARLLFSPLSLPGCPSPGLSPR